MLHKLVFFFVQFYKWLFLLTPESQSLWTTVLFLRTCFGGTTINSERPSKTSETWLCMHYRTTARSRHARTQKGHPGTPMSRKTESVGFCTVTKTCPIMCNVNKAEFTRLITRSWREPGQCTRASVSANEACMRTCRSRTGVQCAPLATRYKRRRHALYDWSRKQY